MKPLRLAVIGVGHLGRIHARLLKDLAGVQLVGVADPSEDNRCQAAEQCGVAALASHRDLLGSIDAAVLASPTSLHHAIGLELLEAGVHLLIEKPLASTPAEADELVRAARRRAVVLQAGHVERFNPAFGSVLPYVRQPKYIEAVRLSGYSGRSTDIGVVLDLMIHDIDLVLSLVRSPLSRVDALGISVLGGFEDAANARLVFDSGCVVNLTASRISYRPARTMQLWSQSGFAAVDFAARTAKIVHASQEILQRRLNAHELPADERLRLKDELFETHLGIEHLQPEPFDQLTAELLDFVDSIRTGRAPRVSGEQARDALQIADRVLGQIAAHSWDGEKSGRTGPHVLPMLPPIPGPHWDRIPQPRPADRREAG